MLDNNQPLSSLIMHLRNTRPWVLFIAILGFIAAALMVIVSLVIFKFASIAPAAMFLGIGYLVVAAAFYFMPGLLLIKFSGAITDCANEGSTATIEAALQRQQSFWRYVGICSIVGIVLFIILVIVGFMHHG